ncbi:MAG TPA: hypothetical protein VGM76_07275 [Lacipirellulaceae bacterium]|jgi:hypothetical protein
MTERERWIVYPLLFLALGAGLRDKLFDQTRSKSIECQDLTVSAEERAGHPAIPLARISAIERSATDKTPAAQMLLNGQIVVDSIRASAVYADRVFADNYVYHGIPFAPTILRAMPGTVSPATPATKPIDAPPAKSGK